MTEKKLPITGLVVGEVSPAVLVCGDPERADKIAAQLTDTQLLSDQREYRSYRGMVEGLPVTVCSHGVGAPGAAIAFEELIVAGAKQIIRVGTCGGLQPEITSGDLVIATGAVQTTGFGRNYVPEGYPAIADAKLMLTLAEVAGETAYRGLVLTSDVFYDGVLTNHTPDYPLLSQANVQAVEMECAALFLVGSLRGIQTGAILAVDGNVLNTREMMDGYEPHRDVVITAVAHAINIALQALKRVNN